MSCIPHHFATYGSINIPSVSHGSHHRERVRAITVFSHKTPYNQYVLPETLKIDTMANAPLFRPLSPEEARTLASHPLCLSLYAEILKVQTSIAAQITVSQQTRSGSQSG